MESTHPTAGWEKVGDRFYRKTQLYTAVFDLDLDLDNFFVAGASYGGAVGVLTPFLLRLLIEFETLCLLTLLRTRRGRGAYLSKIPQQTCASFGMH